MKLRKLWAVGGVHAGGTPLDLPLQFDNLLQKLKILQMQNSPLWGLICRMTMAAERNRLHDV